MDISRIPITDFYDRCLSGAKARGFIWVVSLLAREHDVDNLYYNLKRSWNSLDSITGDYFLFIFAGNEKVSNLERANSEIEDINYRWCKRYNDYVAILNKSKEGEAIIHSKIIYDWRIDADGYKNHIEETQTDAINSLRKYFRLQESNIPCLVFTFLLTKQNYFVPINPDANDIYRYFKELFNDIFPHIDELDKIRLKKKSLIEKKDFNQTETDSMSLDKIEKIISLFIDLKKTAEETKDLNLMDCLIKRNYYKTKQPTRGKLSKYIDLTKDYERKNNKKFIIEEFSEEYFKKINEKHRLEEEIATINTEIEKLNYKYNEIIITINQIIKRSGMNKINVDGSEILL